MNVIDSAIHKRQKNMANLGKLFKMGNKKPAEPPRKDYEGKYRSTMDENEDEVGYLDPTAIHATQPPTNSSSRMPNYPPPRPHHFPDSKRCSENPYRASVPANFGEQMRAPQPKPRVQRPQSAENLIGKFPPKNVKVCYV